MEDYLRYVGTSSVIAFALADINLILTTMILILTIIYWIQRNFKMYQERKLNKQPATDKATSTKDND